jgi:ketosteroid isomerase-like protein
MSADDNRAAALKFIATMAGHGALNESLVTDDFHIWGPTMGTQDTKTYKANVARLRHIMPVLPKFTIISTTAEEDRVAVEVNGSARLADGRLYENNYLMLFEFRDGKIRSIKEFLDSKQAFDIFGDSHQ